MLSKSFILGVGITNQSAKNISEYVLHEISQAKKKLFIVTPNPEILVYAQKYSDYKDKLNEADVSLPDGVGVSLAAQLLHVPLLHRIPGVDFIEMLCKASRKKAVSIGFLGGGPGVAREASECLKKKYPWIDVAWVGEEWDFASNSHKEKLPKIDILFVAFGFPKQEEWIYKNLPHLPVKAAMGVGGSFDYLSGRVPRAPAFLRSIGLEWLFRLIRQPWRIKRQLALIEFVWLVLKEASSKSSK